MLPFETGIMSAIMNRLPPRTKRSIFLASLYAECCDKPNLGELNNSLSLVKDIAALELPAVLHRWLWKSAGPLTGGLVTTYGVQTSGETVIRSTPKWLIYASQAEMVRDIDRLVALVKKA